MLDPFNLPGPAFLALWFTGLLAVWPAVFLAKWFVARRTGARPVDELRGRSIPPTGRTGRLPVLLERDHAFDSRSELDRELEVLAARLAAAPPVTPPRRATTPSVLLPPDRDVLGRTHHDLLAALLASDGDAPPGVPT